MPAASHSPQPKPIPRTFLAATAFLDETRAWASVYSYATRQSVLLETTDSGRSWQQRLQLKGHAGWMRFFNKREAVVRVATSPGPPLETSIYRTADGGLTWTSAPAPPNPLPAPPLVDFLDLDRGWLIQIPTGGASRVLFRTADGGRTWNELAKLEAGNAVTFKDALTGWLAARPSSVPALLRTRDGGLTWQAQLLPPLPDGSVGQVGASAPVLLDLQLAVLQVAILSRPDDPPLRLLDSYLYWSHDGGGTWSLGGRLPLNKVKGDDYGSAYSFMNGRGLAGSATSFYRTADGGAIWTTVATSLPRSGFYFAEVAAFTDQVVWGQLSDFSKREGHQPIFVLVRSTDGGAHWTELKIPGLEG
jgi:photosystem II stability/assembly factor-like uncharacterized protein